MKTKREKIKDFFKMIKDFEKKKEKIKQLYKEGKIKKLNNGCYSVSSELFVLGITPRLIKEVLK